MGGFNPDFMSGHFYPPLANNLIRESLPELRRNYNKKAVGYQLTKYEIFIEYFTGAEEVVLLNFCGDTPIRTEKSSFGEKQFTIKPMPPNIIFIIPFIRMGAFVLPKPKAEARCSHAIS